VGAGVGPPGVGVRVGVDVGPSGVGVKVDVAGVVRLSAGGVISAPVPRFSSVMPPDSKGCVPTRTPSA